MPSLASDLFSSQTSSSSSQTSLAPYFPSSCSSLDSLLGGGAYLGEVLEVCGLADSDKSIIALSIAVGAVANGGAALVIATTTEPFTLRAASMLSGILSARVAAALASSTSRAHEISISSALPRMAAKIGPATSEIVLRNDIAGSLLGETRLAGSDLRVAVALDVTSIVTILKRLEAAKHGGLKPRPRRGFLSRLKVLHIDGIAGAAYPVLWESKGHAALADIGARLARLARDGPLAVVVSNAAVSEDSGAGTGTGTGTGANARPTGSGSGSGSGSGLGSGSGAGSGASVAPRAASAGDTAATLRDPRAPPQSLRAALGGAWAMVPDTSVLVWRNREVIHADGGSHLHGAVLKMREPLVWIGGGGLQESLDGVTF